MHFNHGGIVENDRTKLGQVIYILFDNIILPPDLCHIIGPKFKETEAKKIQAHKSFVDLFNAETRGMIQNTPIDSNLTCPECTEEVHGGSFHRNSSCVLRNKKLLLKIMI